MSEPTPVSAVICTRNRPDLIGTAVASVLANTYPTFDLLVVDQSTDGRTGDIVRFTPLSRDEYDELQAAPREPRFAQTSFSLEEFEADPDGYNARLLEVLG